MLFVLLAFLQAAPQADPLPVVEVTSDDFVVDRSCRLVLPPEPIPDAGEPGVVLVRGEQLTIQFEGTLRGAPEGTPWDELTGVGVQVAGRGHTLLGGKVHGFKVGLQVIKSRNLVVRGWDVSDNFRQRLGSTPEREDSADWLRPHDNWRGQWSEVYGAGIQLRQCHNVTLQDCRARRTQNGLLMELVSGSKISGNDFSYLSGWGIALWRSYENRIFQNHVDFCVRGYSHGVYNRGQDSAGILLFEQNHRNEVRENSATHCGDGVFAYSGIMALGQKDPAGVQYNYARRGNQNNLFYRNDLSFAAAHGLETTFGFGDRVIQNLLEGNAICGLWGGYSRDMEIHGNRFLRNGDAGYGAERGGINIEHGSNNSISSNEFRDNAVGVRLWWDEDEELAALPWVEANGAASLHNEVFGNRFRGGEIGIELDRAGETYVQDNRFRGVATDLVRDEASPAWTSDTATTVRTPTVPAKPRGVAVRGREHIVIGEWGPWDGEEPLLLRQGGNRWRVLPGRSGWALDGEGPKARTTWADGRQLDLPIAADGTFEVSHPSGAGVIGYDVEVEVARGEERRVLEGRGLAAHVRWAVRCFETTVDPREDDDAWRAAAEASPQHWLDELDLDFGTGAPVAVDRWLMVERPDHFGVLAETSVALPAGDWILDTTSDDGIRVLLDGARVIDDWTWHAPKRNVHAFTLDEARSVSVRVEHFELDGHAELRVALRPADR